jgi:hypothetical protein
MKIDNIARVVAYGLLLVGLRLGYFLVMILLVGALALTALGICGLFIFGLKQIF